MSWQIAADIREIFVEVVARNQGRTYCIRTLNRKDQLLSGLAEALGLLSPHLKVEEATLAVKTDWERVALRERWGGPAAFLATEGFENLLEVGDQRRVNEFGLHAGRVKPLIPREFSFGVTERTMADGRVEIGLDEKEIDFVISKLKLADVRALALCFLHSNVNPQHENQLAEKLREQGYEVYTSHSFPGHERSRAAAATAKAFTATGFGQFIADIEKMGFNGRVTVAPEPVEDNPSVLSCDFLEDRILARWNAAGKPCSAELDLSPLSRVSLDEGGLVHVGPDKIESEPGPVVFGKGIVLSLLDLFAFNSKLTAGQIPRLKADPSRVLKQLAPLAKQLQLDPQTCAQKYINLAYDLTALELRRRLGGLRADTLKLEGRGWLAPLMAGQVARRLGVKSFQVSQGSSWAAAHRLLGGLPASEEKTLIGELGFEQDTLAEGDVYDG